MAKACKTQARKTLETSPTEPTKRKEKDSLQALRHRKKHFYYSQVRTSGIAPKSSRNLALENGSESLEQQQDSCPRHAKHKPIKLSKRRLRNPLKGKKKDSLQAFRHRKKHFYYSQVRSGLGKPHPKASNSSRIRAQSTRNASPTNPKKPVPKHPNSSRIRAHAKAQVLSRPTSSRHQKAQVLSRPTSSRHQTPKRAPPLARGRRISCRQLDDLKNEAEKTFRCCVHGV